jgi:hypothetical protein
MFVLTVPKTLLLWEYFRSTNHDQRKYVTVANVLALGCSNMEHINIGILLGSQYKEIQLVPYTRLNITIQQNLCTFLTCSSTLLADMLVHGVADIPTL